MFMGLSYVPSMVAGREGRAAGRSGLSAMQGAFDFRLIETNDDASVDVDYGNAHLTGFPHHLIGLVLVRSDIVFGKGYAPRLEIVFCHSAVSAARSRIKRDGHRSLPK